MTIKTYNLKTKDGSSIDGVLIDDNDLQGFLDSYLEVQLVEQEPPPPPRPVIPSWDELQLKRAFTQEERLAIRAAKQTDPIVDDVMDLLEATVRSGGRVKANDPDFISGLNYFVSVDLLTEERKETILSGQLAVIVDPDSSPV